TMRELHDLSRDADVVVEVRRRLPVLAQRAVHHHGREAHLDRALARLRAVAVVLMHGDRNFGIELGRGEHEVTEIIVLRVAAGPARGLHDHRRVGLARSLHDRLDLLHVVDVERREPVITLRGVIEELAHCDKGHDLPRSYGSLSAVVMTETHGPPWSRWGQAAR